MRGRNKPWAKDFIEAHKDLLFNKEGVCNEESFSLQREGRS